MSRRSSLSGADAVYLSHVVEVTTAEATTSSLIHSPAARWYPLHQLARWSGVVPATAAPPVVKRAMAEARAAIEARTNVVGKSNGKLEDAYQKIGQTMSVTIQLAGAHLFREQRSLLFALVVQLRLRIWLCLECTRLAHDAR